MQFILGLLIIGAITFLGVTVRNNCGDIPGSKEVLIWGLAVAIAILSFFAGQFADKEPPES